MRRYVKREVLSMEPSARLTNRGNPVSWHIKYDCGHEDLFRAHHGHFYALQGILSHGYKITMCCGECS
ncbi:hypothetical protein LCGC14_0411900 [marine sediment metagenome]|uniref:Uncharacterized protein n=1 Tax=marine sediment metagenome TaxID=412755 RepID=A0A0F9W2U8_9ZZZZ